MSESVRSIDKLSLYLRRSGRLVKHTSHRGLLVMTLSLSNHRNASHRDIVSACMSIGGEKELSKLDRKHVYRYLKRLEGNLSSQEKTLLKARYIRLGYTLWTRGYDISSPSRYLRSVNHFSWCTSVSDLGISDINEIIRKVRKEGIRSGRQWWREEWNP